jgi:putative hydrolase of the HAD superfamily
MGILREIVASDRYVVGALNNEARETNAFRFEHFGLRELFQVALSSCYLGLRKPDPEIYERALEILCRPAERILLIDDRQENVTAAEASGMKAILFENSGALRLDLESLGVF